MTDIVQMNFFNLSRICFFTGDPLFPSAHHFPRALIVCVCVLPEVTVPVSLKEVGGYIEKQVAYLTGEAW